MLPKYCIEVSKMLAELLKFSICVAKSNSGRQKMLSGFSNILAANRKLH